MRNLFTKHERKYILKHTQGKKQFPRNYEVIVRMIDRVPEVQVEKEKVHFTKKSDFAIEPKTKKEDTFKRRITPKWEMNETEYQKERKIL